MSRPAAADDVDTICQSLPEVELGTAVAPKALAINFLAEHFPADG